MTKIKFHKDYTIDFECSAVLLDMYLDLLIFANLYFGGFLNEWKEPQDESLEKLFMMYTIYIK